MFILLKIYLLWKIWPIPVKAVETGVDPRLVIQELHYLSTVLFWKNKKQLPEENNWTWVKRPVLISLAEDKIALIWSATQASFFLQALYSSLQRLWNDTKVFDSSYTTIQCSLFYEKTTPLWFQQTSFLNKLKGNLRIKDAASTYKRPKN